MNSLTIVLAIITIAIVAAAIYATREIHRMMVEALNNLTYDESDEFEYKDDPYAELVRLAPAFTCHRCCDKNSCVYAFDQYCTDGDCLMVK